MIRLTFLILFFTLPFIIAQNSFTDEDYAQAFSLQLGLSTHQSNSGSTCFRNTEYILSNFADLVTNNAFTVEDDFVTDWVQSIKTALFQDCYEYEIDVKDLLLHATKEPNLRVTNCNSLANYNFAIQIKLHEWATSWTNGDYVQAGKDQAILYRLLFGVNYPPVADFNYGESLLDATFDGTISTDRHGSIVSYEWDFGEPSSLTNTDTTSQPVHTYATAGTYTVKLTVADDEGIKDQITKSVSVYGVVNVPPVAGFTFTTNNLRANLDGRTSSDSDGTIASYAWNFGESSSSSNTATTSTPSHIYAAPGTYTVTLVVTDNRGSTHTVTHSVTVSTVPNVAPTASFTYIATDLDVAFDGTGSTDSDGNIGSYSWDFGDSSSQSNTDTASQPSHTFSAAGTYTVTLTVTDNRGATHTATRVLTVLAPNIPPTSLFTYLATDLDVNFDGTTSIDTDGQIMTYAWDFGESTSASNIASTAQPQHSYAAGGTYIVTLTVTDDRAGTHTSTQSVTVQPPNVLPVSSFTYTTAYSVVNFNGLGSSDADGSIAGYAWDFGESSSGSNTATIAQPQHTYAAGGTYTVTLTVTDNRGGQHTSTQSITVVANVAPTASFTTLSTFLVVAFDAAGSTDSDGTIASYAWNFGEPSSGASNTATTSQPSHTYAAGGTYTISLTVTDNGGATHSTTRTITVNARPTASFTFVKTYLAVAFDGTGSTDSDGTIASYAWTFGEASSGASNTATTSQPSHTYAAAGTYTVTLTVTDNLGATHTATQTVTVAPNQAPIASLSCSIIANSIDCTGAASTDSDGTIVSYAWTFGETSSSTNTGTGVTVSHTYAATGTYTVRLTVTDNLGLTGTATQSRTITQVVGSGNLQINVVWNRAGDGDLVLTTPNGKSIYWNNLGPTLNTDWGNLDADDQSLVGPENIYWATSYTPPTGTYHVCFQLYSFTGLPGTPVVATLNIRTPTTNPVTITKSFTIKSLPNVCSPTQTATYMYSFNYP